MILHSISDTDKIGHLFLVDIKFHKKNEKAMLFHEIYTPIFRKNRVIQAQQKSVLQLMSVISRNEPLDPQEKKVYPSICGTDPFFSKKSWIVSH